MQSFDAEEFPHTGFTISNPGETAIDVDGGSALIPLGLLPGENVQDGFALLDSTLLLQASALNEEGGGRADIRTTYRMDLADARIMRFSVSDGRWVRAIHAIRAESIDNIDFRFTPRMEPDGVLGHYGNYTDTSGNADYRLQTSSLYFEGGNIVSDNEFILIGANTIRQNALKLDLSEAQVVTRFQEELGRQLLVVGPYPQPIAHIPLLYGGPESLDRGNGVVTTTAAYPMLTYNNALIARQDVYLPRYGWSAMDEAAFKTWKKLGFTPHSIEGFTTSAMYGGSLRCSVKVLER